MSELGVVYVDVEGDFSGMQKKAKGGFGKFGKLAAGAFAAGFAVLGAAKIFGGLIDSASDLGESVNAVEVTFGDAANGIKGLGETAARELGLANTEFNTLSVGFAGFTEAIAGPGGDVVKVIDDLTTRSSDFASVMNIEVADAATKFKGALAGESEAMRAYGIDVSAAAVQTFAYENGIASAGETLTESQKVQARYGLVMQETEKFAGDFANTSGSLANQQKIASAQFENAKASLGEGLMPIMTAFFGIINEVGIPALEALVPVFEWLGEVITPVVELLGGFIAELFGSDEGMESMTEGLGNLGAAFEGWWAPVESIFNSFVELWDFAVAAFAENKDWIDAMLADMQVFFDQVWGEIGEIVVAALELIAAVIDRVVQAIMWVWENFGDEILLTITFIWDRVKSVVTVALAIIKGVIKTVTALIKGDWEGAWEAIKEMFAAIWQFMQESVSQSLTFIWDLIRGIGPKILALSSGWSKLLFSAGKAIIQGLIDGIKSIAGRIISTIKNAVTDKIPGWIKSRLGISSPSTVFMEFGMAMSEGMAVGIDDGAPMIQKAISRMGGVPDPLGVGAGLDDGVVGPGLMVTNNFHGPVGGSMASFAKEIAREGGRELRFTYG